MALSRSCNQPLVVRLLKAVVEGVRTRVLVVLYQRSQVLVVVLDPPVVTPQRLWYLIYDF